MADTETRLVALEQAFYVLVRALEEKRVLEPGDVTKRLQRMEETLRDSTVTALADAIREVRKNLD
jgi:RNA polymerase-interacting CarD/CdnL/TRCF family regulator